jgi:hypothetical protein
VALAVLFTLACDGHDSGPVGPFPPDPGPPNPDGAIAVRAEQIRYASPATVRTWVHNLSAETRYWWNQCLPSVEVWRENRWQGLAEICFGDAPDQLAPGESLAAIARIGSPGVYRTVIPVSSEPSSVQLVYRSGLWVVE